LVSYVYTELEKLNPKTVLHERETSSSGRPKATHGIEEDAENFYTYTRTGKVTVYPKADSHKYWDFLQNQVIYQDQSQHQRLPHGQGTMHKMSRGDDPENPIVRITPATDYEISMGYGAFNPFAVNNPASSMYIPRPSKGNFLQWWQGAIGTPLKNLSHEHFRKLQEAQDEADRLAYLAEQERLKKLRETARPNPKEVEKVEPVEPIKEIVKYSPLMIAGVIAVVVILLLKRRRA
tara:strand:- start:279 stop:983 length:705 start_codon:yes stop_codon:yes gene_type:complete